MATGGKHAQELKGSDQVIDFSCTFCSENEGLTTEAQFYCKECVKCFCTECVILHNGLYKKHVVSGREEKDEWPVNESNLGLEKCDQHPDKDIELFCEDHSQLCCLLCQFTNHRLCDVVFVAEKEQGFQPTVDTQAIIANIESQLIHVKEMMSFRDKKNISSQESYKKTSEDIKALRKHFEEMFDKIEKNTIRDLDNKMEELKDTLKSDMENLSQVDVNLKRINAAISAQTRKGYPLTFMMEMKYMNIMSTSESILDDLDEGNDAVITFECNPEIESFVDQIMSFGQFCISKSPSTTPVYISPKHIDQHCIRMSHERVCDIRGICELSDGTLVIADRTNISIKVLDDKYNVVHHMTLAFPPNDICCVSSTKVAVAMNSMTGGQIIILNVTTKNVTVENTYEFKHNALASP
ncbi:hypothetical protein DPMN_094801 [Dreissena polymorpha]|uniref:B box-type domain-containing protein n=1 Tax=Dreissena polymorpha TaxID=45954 RepID=A0A9D4L827_DREPO|nr:hypothetical protein DPMN_094801 [Dreissena polymorpha]